MQSILGKDIDVTLQVDGIDKPVGTMRAQIDSGTETTSFTYDPAYLRDPDAFPLAPNMPLTSETLHTPRTFGIFFDASCDQWGYDMIARNEQHRATAAGEPPRDLSMADFLVRVDDTSRPGALRFWIDGRPASSSETKIPMQIGLADLLEESTLPFDDRSDDTNHLIDPSWSLRGSHPKASVFDDEGNLLLAKFPRRIEGPAGASCAKEHAALELAGQCGIDVPKSKLLNIGGKPTLLLERFDRKGERRIHYMSAQTIIGGPRRRTSYLQIVDFLEREGACPDQDIPQLWKRILLFCLVGNLDDHAHNHGFLKDKGGWRLAPAFDIEPLPCNESAHLCNEIAFGDRSATIENALRGASCYRVSKQEAEDTLELMLEAMRKRNMTPAIPLRRSIDPVAARAATV